ncbi:hypothetical protein LOTGIDRAFT_153874 [Lottia gigantea]|uniref:Uncharacterized protein n=1 Tax=Lottia gigantea TaxID=225164 RepID=V4ADN9_LOTGI|nr:hypothetical protein LOTGIDRAFT_153874 [Lottia gigantea]ESO91431.1 hypothetical protein LOTGIDRAFT_153874 [Lottia gigantea]
MTMNYERDVTDENIFYLIQINGGEGKDTKLLSRIRRQIWGGSYNMIFGRQQCDDKPCLVDEECCRGYSCFNPKQLTSRQAKSLGVCLDDVDILRLEAELLS